MSNEENFIPVTDHFDRLLAELHDDDIDLYGACANTRVEQCYRGRSLIVYEIVDREPKVLDRFVVQDYQCNERDGATTEIRSDSGETLAVGFAPVRLLDYDILLWLPLHSKLRWSASASQLRKDIFSGSLAFPMCVRTRSRLHLRERGVHYCETGVNYAREFESPMTV